MSGHVVIKFIFILINLIYLISGIALTTLSIMGQYKLDLVSNALGVKIFVTVNLILGVGIFAIILSLLGLIAGCSERPGLLIMFGVILIILLIIQFSAAVAVFVMKNKIVHELDQVLTEQFDKAYQNNTAFATKLFNELQKDGQCCGLYNVTDYITRNKTIPEICCKQVKPCTKHDAYQNGCLAFWNKFVADTFTNLALIDIIFCLVVILQIMFSCCLGRSMKTYTRV